jgi:hypothetical protein
MSAVGFRDQLHLLELERMAAASTGLLEVESYKRDLEEEIAKCRVSYVSAAVIEIARLRDALAA